MLHIPPAQQNQGTKFNLVLLTLFNASHHPVERAGTGAVHAVGVVKFSRPINADAQQKFIVVKELAPIVIEQNAVGLQRVADLLTGLATFFLQFNRPSEEIYPHQGRLTALPGKADHGKAKLHVVFDQPLEHRIAHALPTLAKFGSPALVEAVFAINIAIRPGWLNQKRKRLHYNV